MNVEISIFYGHLVNI